MGNQTEYFERTGYKPEYWIGDRVFGHFNGIPFAGTVGNDTIISPVEGPRISIHLDLPIKIDSVWHNNIRATYKQIKGLRL